MMRDLSRHVDRAGHISIEVKIGRHSLGERTEMASNHTPLANAEFLRRLADDVAAADPSRRSEEILDRVRGRAMESYTSDPYDPASVVAGEILDLLDGKL